MVPQTWGDRAKATSKEQPPQQSPNSREELPASRAPAFLLKLRLPLHRQIEQPHPVSSGFAPSPVHPINLTSNLAADLVGLQDADGSPIAFPQIEQRAHHAYDEPSHGLK